MTTTHPLFTESDQPTAAPAPRGRPPEIPFERVRDICEAFYERDGFVVWKQAASALGTTRQNLRKRLDSAVRQGRLSQEDYDRWHSVSSRRAVTRERVKRNEVAKADRSKRTFQVIFTPENYAWVRAQSVLLGVTAADVVNGLVTLAIEEKRGADENVRMG